MPDHPDTIWPPVRIIACSTGSAARLEHKVQKSSDSKSSNQRNDGSPQEPLEVIEVLLGHHDMLRTGNDQPAWREHAYDEPVEDEQIDEVEEEKQAEDVREEFPEGQASRSEKHTSELQSLRHLVCR